MKWRPHLIRLFLVAALLIVSESAVPAAGSTSVAVSATVLSRNNCQFRPPRSAVLNFGNLDPTDPIPVSASTSLDFRCAGSEPLATFSMSTNGGLHFSSGSRQMQSTTDAAAYIPYDLTLTPQSATVPKNSNQTLTIDGTIAGAGYRYAPAGTYQDEVVISINP